MLSAKISAVLQRVKPYLQSLCLLSATQIEKIRHSNLISQKSWKIIVIAFIVLIIILYYPLGGIMVHKIDTNHKAIPNPEDARLASIDMMSQLINREVHLKIWTPGLPFMFPSYFLDNMPNFQLGIISAISKTVSSLNRLPFNHISDEARQNLQNATEYLNYPGSIWMFSPENHLLPSPSSAGQYKKGRKKLNNFNHFIASQPSAFSHDAQNLKLIMIAIKKDINKQISKTDAHVREHIGSIFDTTADDIFYFSQGKLYAYERILTALGIDFKHILIKHDIYQQWTTMLKILEHASDLNPSIIRNAKPNASMSPNHLITINYYAARTLNTIDNIINQLNKNIE